MVKWMNRLKSAHDDLSKTHDALVKQHADGGDAVSAEKLADFHKAWNEVQDTAVMFDLPKVSIDALRPEENRIPITVLSALEPILA
jgi:hypothetical protein